MNIALVGYGRMGKEIEQIALSRGHQISLIVDENNKDSIQENEYANTDVAIEFSLPESAFENTNKFLDRNIPVVSGTTGWLDKLPTIIDRCNTEGKTFFYASNYSLGVNLFFKLNKFLAKLMGNFTDYKVHIEETHHTKKLDAPSGTAITLAEGVMENNAHVKAWEKENTDDDKKLFIDSFREGNVPGNHKVIYESGFDKIEIEHDAKSRKGFALGAVLAAEFVKGKKGYLTMDDLLEIS